MNAVSPCLVLTLGTESRWRVQLVVSSPQLLALDVSWIEKINRSEQEVVLPAFVEKILQ